MKNPELRFKNDIDDWQEKELQDIATINKGQQLNKTVMVENGDYYVLNGGSSPSGKTNSFNTNENTISISEGGNSCGFVNLNKEKFWSGGHNYTLNKLNDNVDFIYQILKSNQDKIMDLRVGTGIPNIQRFNLEQFKITLSKDTTIQSQIATLLSDIDTKIETQEQKVEKLKIFKSAMLDKMFPKEGQKVPEIRFNGFSGDWEEKELGSVLTLQGGYAFSSKNMSQTGIKIVQIGNVYSNFLDWNNIVYLNENFASNCENFFLKENDLVIAMTRPIISSLKSVKIAKIQKDDLPCLLNQRVGRFLLSNKIVNSFLKCFMETKYFYENVLEKCSSGVQPNISSKDIESIKCYLSPTLKEQEKIGKYFEELDNKIELETSKLNKLKDVKNAMLNKLLP